MTAAAVAFNGTRVNASDAATNWANWVVGGAAPAAEAQLAYQNALAVNKKIISTTARQGLQYNPAASPLDMTAAANKLLFFKGIVSDSFSLNTTFGCEVLIGSDSTHYHGYNVAGSGAKLSCYNKYPVQGGYLITSIDPNIAAWRDNSVSTPVLTAVDWFAFSIQFASGVAKSENVAFDSIDVGTGLTITLGDGADAPGTFIDFVTKDQDTTTNRWGVVVGSGNIVRCYGLLTVGTGTVTEFTDTTSIVLFPDGYHSAGLVGVAVGMSHVSSIIQIDSLLIGEGTVQASAADDTRPDLVVTGTSGTFACAATMSNFRNITFTSVCSVSGANLQCQLLTQGGALIHNSTIRTKSLVSTAALVNPTFGATTLLHDTAFIQTGAGHAIELSTVNGTYTFTGLTFSGYGADASNSAAIYVSAVSGTTTINYSGSAPTYKSAGATVTLVGGSVSATATVTTAAGAAIQTAVVMVKAKDGTGPLPFEDVVTIANSGTTATVTNHTAHALLTSDKVLIAGASLLANNGIFSIVWISSSSYSYTMGSSPGSSPTGTITSTFVALSGTTDTNGQITMNRVFTDDQPVIGWARKSSGSPYYKTGPINGVIDSALGATLSAVLVLDE